MEHTVPVLLIHTSMYVETGVAQLCDLLSQEFHTVGRVAEDDGLIDLQLRTNTIT